MYKIRDNVDLEELEKFGFWKDSNFKILHREASDDINEQLRKTEYLLIMSRNRVIVKAKLEAILDFNENIIHGYKMQTNRVKKYIKDLIEAGIVEKVEDK